MSASLASRLKDRIELGLRADRAPRTPDGDERRAIARSVFLAAALPLAFYLLLTSLHGVQVSRAGFVIDFALLAVLFGSMLMVQRRHRLAVAPFVAVVCLVYWAALYKYEVLDLWVRFSDLSLLDEGWQVLTPLQRISTLALPIAALLVVLYNLCLPSPRVLAALLASIGVVLVPALVFPGPLVEILNAATNARYGNDPLYRSVLFAAGYDFLERLRFEQQSRSFLERHPAEETEGISIGALAQRRNVHILVLESFMDPKLLDIDLSEDPFDPRIRRDLGGSSLSPVFAGRSAQAEFELACGTPVYDFLDPITFNDFRGEPIDCLPTLLARQGYVTLASHDVEPNFFNARQAYQSVGFSRFYFAGEFSSTDMDGSWVSADEQIAFNKEHIQPLLDSGQPFLNYVFFTTGHVPYEMNPVTRPLVIRTSSTEEVTRFVNAVYYNSRAIGTYIEFLSKNDPTSIVVVVGDHQGALRSIDRTHARRYDYDRYLVPYLFVDAGEPRMLGDLAHFELPRLIAASLSGRPLRTIASTYDVDFIRPFNEHAFYQREGQVHRCPDSDDPFCPAIDGFREGTIARWLRLIEGSKRRS